MILFSRFQFPALPLMMAGARHSVGLGASPFIYLVLLAVLFRGAVGLAMLDRFDADPDAYRAIAETLGESGVFGLTTSTGDVVPTAFRPPLYPYLLSWAVSDGALNNFLIVIFHSLLGGLTAGFTYLAGAKWLGPEGSRFRGILAALLVIVDPILIQQSTLVMTETLATALTSMVIWWWMCHVSNRLTIVSAVVLGGLLALAFLSRPTFAVWTGMLVVCLAFSNEPSEVSRSRRYVAAGVTALVVLSAISLWTLRNASVLGHPIWATSHGGYTLLLGNNPLIYRHIREQGPLRSWDAQPFLDAYGHRYEADPATEEYWLREWKSPPRAQPELSATLTEHDDDQLTYQAAVAAIRRDRALFVVSCLVRVYNLWTPFPHKTENRSSIRVLGIGSYYSLFYVAAVIGLARLGKGWRRSICWPVPTLVLSLTLVHAVYWSNMRMRAPAIPALAMLAAAAALPKPERTDV